MEMLQRTGAIQKPICKHNGGTIWDHVQESSRVLPSGGCAGSQVTRPLIQTALRCNKRGGSAWHAEKRAPAAVHTLSRNGTAHIEKHRRYRIRAVAG